jgi:phosphoglycerate dehydrogenase-like enzyme
VTRVAVLDDYQHRAAGFADWGSLAPEITVDFLHEPIPVQRLPERLAGYDVLVLMRERTRFDAGTLAQLPRLRLVVTTGMRNASLDVAYLRERGVTVCGTGMSSSSDAPGVPTTTEVAWALILAAVKRVTIEDRELRAGRWQTELPSNLGGATLGLAGLGRLGASMVAPARAFGMDVIAWSQNLTAERAAEVGVRAVGKDELFSTSDVVTLHLQLSDRTRGIVGVHELALMQPTAYLVNTSRGPLVDETALVAALSGRQLAGAGLDVFDVEPLPLDHPLRSMPNTVLTPHIGYVTGATYERWWTQVVEDILAWANAESLRVLS